MTTQRWILQGRSSRGFNEWLDLFERRRIRDLPRVNPEIARMIGAEYRIVLKSGGAWKRV